jgi:cold shock CspA family protein
MAGTVTIASVRTHGVRQLLVYCLGKREGDWPCHHSGKLPIERFQAEEVLSDIERRYGFIRPDAGERDIFAHRDECDIPAGEEIRIGDRVSYEIGADRRPGKKPRLCALNVRFVADKDEKQAPGMYGGIEESSTGACRATEGFAQ